MQNPVRKVRSRVFREPSQSFPIESAQRGSLASLLKGRVGIRSRLITLVVVAVLPVILFSAALLNLLRQQHTANVELVLHGTSRALAAAVDERIASFVTGLNMLGVWEDFKPSQVAMVYRRAVRAIATGDGWQSISLLDRSGNQIFNTLRPLGTELPSLRDRDFVSRVLATGRPAISGYQIGKTSLTQIVNIAVPVKHGVMTTHVLAGGIPLGSLQDLLSAQQIPAEWTAAIVDADLRILARTRFPGRYVGGDATPQLAKLIRESKSKSGMFYSKNKEGQQVHGAFAESKVTGWTFIMALPAGTLMLPIHRILWSLALGGGALLMLGMGIATAVGRKISRPMAQLSQMAIAFGKGERSEPVESNVSEIAEVAVALEHAAEHRTRIEATLREANQVFDALIEASPVGILMLDSDGTVRVWNRSAEKILGWTAAEAQGFSLAKLPQPCYAEFQTLVLSTFGGTGLNAIEWRQTNRNGEPLVLQVSTALLRLMSERRRYVLAILEDVTERTRTLQRLAEERHTIDALHHLGTTLSRELALVPLLQNLTDESTDLAGAEWGAYFAKQEGELLAPLQLVVASGSVSEEVSLFLRVFGSDVLEQNILRIDDIWDPPARYAQLFPNLSSKQAPFRSLLMVPIFSRNREVIGALLFGHPEASIFGERQVALLASVGAQAAVAIDNAKLYSKAKAAIEVRDTFLSIASHELKTPLTALQLQMQLLERKTRMNETLQATVLTPSLDRLMNQCRRMSRLIDELLDVSRLSTGQVQLNPESLDLAALVKEVSQNFESELERSGSSLRVHAPECLAGVWDRFRLEQVLTNLIGNAIKYGNGKPIDITVEKTETATVRIRDRGIGVAREDQSRIFERFERAASPQNYGGLGLGLWIVSRILDTMGGKISIQSELAEGSEFSLVLPLHASPQQSAT